MTIKTTLFALTTSAIALFAASAASAADVIVSLKGIQAGGGTLYVSLQTEEQFMKNDGTAGEIIKDINAGDAIVTLSDVEPGAYALSIWHDREDDEKFLFAPEGWPNEGWAMINGDKLQGPPTFDLVSFELTDAGFATTLTIIYPPE